MSESIRPHIVIVGLMGIGKSTLANGLAEALKLPQADSDRDIEVLTGMHAAEYAAANGVPALHRLETAVLLGRLAAPEPTVISAAASTIEHDECRAALNRRAQVLWIDLDIDTMRSESSALRRRTRCTASDYCTAGGVDLRC